MDYRAYARQVALQQGLDPNLVEATMFTESNGNPNAVSPKGATGLMQLMPGTAKELGVDPRDPYQNIEGGVRYLKQQVDKYGVAGGLAAYNAGPGNYQKSGGDFNALPNETKAYVPKVMNRAATIAQGGTMTQPPASPSIGQMQRALEKARAANDQAAVDEIGGMLQGKFQSALQKAQAAGDTAAVAEIQGFMDKSFPLTVPAPGKVESQALPDITPPENKPQAAPVAEEAPPAPETPQDIPAPAAASNPAFTTPQVTEGGAVLTSRRKGQAAGKQVTEDDSLGKRLFRTADDVVRGIADTATFGYADELAAGADSAAQKLADRAKGIPYIGNGISTVLGSLSQSGEADYDKALAAQRQRDSEGGTARTVGQIGGAFLPTVGVVRALPTAGKLAHMGAGAATGAIQGGLYGTGSADGDWANRVQEGAKDALLGAGVGAVAGGIGGLLTPALKSQKVNDFIKKAGSSEDAATNAEIIKKLAAEREAASRSIFGETPNLQRVEVNKRVTNDILKEARSIVEALPKEHSEKAALLNALKTGTGNSQRVLEDLANIPGGQEVVDIVNKAVRSDRMTAPTPASNGFIMKGARFANKKLLPGFISDPISYMLNNRKTSEEVTNNLINKYGGLADDVLAKTGASPASQGVTTLQELAEKAKTDVAARRALAQQEKVAEAAKAAQAAEVQAAESLAQRNQTLKDTAEISQSFGGRGSPAGNGYQKFMDYTGLDNDTAIKTLRKFAKDFPDNEIGIAAKQMLQSQPVTNDVAFYKLQDIVKGNKGALGIEPGALTNAGSARSNVVNQKAYDANVDNAMGALKVATENAPSPAMAQFASSVAGTKDPAAKAKMVQERLAQATDPAEIDFLKTMVEPLTKFGKKAPKADKGPLKVEINGILPENQR